MPSSRCLPAAVAAIRPSSRVSQPSPIRRSTAAKLEQLLQRPAAQGLETRDVDALAQAQAHHQQLFDPLIAAEDGARALAGAGALGALEPDLRQPPRFGRDAQAALLEPAVGAGADAEPFAASPVDQVVPASLARAGVVGDLVGGKAGGGEHLLGALVQIRLRLVVGHLQRAGSGQEMEARAGLDGQLIDAEMPVGMAQRALELGFPGGRRLAGPGVDQIEREAREQPRRQVDRRERLGRACARGRGRQGRRRRAPERRARPG